LGPFRVLAAGVLHQPLAPGPRGPRGLPLRAHPPARLGVIPCAGSPGLPSQKRELRGSQDFKLKGEEVQVRVAVKNHMSA